ALPTHSTVLSPTLRILPQQYEHRSCSRTRVGPKSARTVRSGTATSRCGAEAAQFEKPNFHRIVHTVQYNSAHNPIEIIWSAVKGHVAQQHTADRTTEQLIGHIHDHGFYGTADRQWEGITATRCQNAIAHAKGVASALISAHPRLRGCYPVGTA